VSPKRKARRYWDANCFLAIINHEPDQDTCLRILTDAAGDSPTFEIIVSPLTLVEVIRPKGAPVPLSREHEQQIKDFFENDYIIMRNTDRLIAEVARELCWNHGLHPRDAIHLATAIETECDWLETTDPRLLRLSGVVPDAPIIIREPMWTGQLPLPGTPGAPELIDPDEE
jgi:predicted nucleic acid-binding protein